MTTWMQRFCVFLFLMVTQIELAVCDVEEFSLDEFLNFVLLAQTEITSGELKIIKKLDTLPTISLEKANADAEAVIQELEKRYQELPVEVQEQPSYRRQHERNVQLSRKYLPEVISGERHLHEEWNLAFEIAYFSAKSKEPIFAHRFIRKDIKDYVSQEAAEFFHAGLTHTVMFDGQRAVVSSEAPPNLINPPEPLLGVPQDFVYEIRQLIGRCIETDLQKQDIEIFVPITGRQSAYAFAFRIGKDDRILKKALIDVEKGFGVERIEYFAPPDAEHPYNVVEFLEYQFSSGIWHPRRIKRTGYQMKGDTRLISSVEEWKITSAMFNVSFPDDYFQFPNKLTE